MIFQRTVYLRSPRDTRFAFKMLPLWLPLWLTVPLRAKGMLGGQAAWQQPAVGGRRWS